jgi:hypothetical protein
MITIAYNVEYVNMNLEFIKNDSIDMAFLIKKNGIDYDLTSMVVTMSVRDFSINKTLIKSFTSIGTIPSIILYSNTITLFSVIGFENEGKYIYDMQIANGTSIMTVMSGILTVKDEKTI